MTLGQVAVPDETKAVSNIESPSRSCRNAEGQAVGTNSHFRLAGPAYTDALAYTARPALGVAGANSNRTTQD